MAKNLCDIAHAPEGQEPLGEMALALSEGADPNDVCAWTGRAALMLCAQRGWSGCVSILLGAGADPRQRDRFGRDALMLALIAREVHCAKILAPLSRARSRDAKGRCALALAAMHAPHRADADLMRMLWTPGADRWRDCEGKTAKDYALEGGMDFSGVEGFARARVEARALGRASKEASRSCRAMAL